MLYMCTYKHIPRRRSTTGLHGGGVTDSRSLLVLPIGASPQDRMQHAMNGHEKVRARLIDRSGGICVLLRGGRLAVITMLLVVGRVVWGGQALVEASTLHTREAEEAKRRHLLDTQAWRPAVIGTYDMMPMGLGGAVCVGGYVTHDVHYNICITYVYIQVDPYIYTWHVGSS